MGRRGQSGAVETSRAEKLAPHSTEAERGVLGSVFLDPSCLQAVEERIGAEPEVFYDLRHREIFAVLQELKRRGTGIDGITVSEALRSVGKLEAVGGGAYLSSLPDGVPSAANVQFYLNVVWEKFLARKKVQDCTKIVRSIIEWEGMPEGLWAEVDRLHEEWKAKAARGTAQPRYLKRASDFAEALEEGFFSGDKEEPGFVLPINFAHKIRFGETTLVYGDDGCGKSTVLKYFLLHLASMLNEGERVTIASFEEPPKMVLRILLTMLMGTRHLPDAQAGRMKFRKALAWVNRRFLFYDFLGIGNYHDLLDTLRYAAEKEGSRIELVDNMMRLGIADDDYSQQAFCAGSFATHAARFGTHLFFVLHENKGDGKGKGRIRGSKLLSANAWNVWQVERNDGKGEKIGRAYARIENEKGQKEPDKKAIDEDYKEIAKLKEDWDTHITLRKQRLDGTQQNASCFFYFDREVLQFRKKYHETAVDWLARWGRPTKHTKDTEEGGDPHPDPLPGRERETAAQERAERRLFEK